MSVLLKVIAAVITRLLGIDEEAEKADMHLSNRALALSLTSVLAVFILIARFFTTDDWVYLIFAAAFLLIAIFILLCYRNQRIYILSDEEFQYTTFLGNKKIYKFDDITALRKNRDSLTLFVGKNKVHIESSAVLSERLKALIIKQFKKEKSDD